MQKKGTIRSVNIPKAKDTNKVTSTQAGLTNEGKTMLEQFNLDK